MNAFNRRNLVGLPLPADALELLTTTGLPDDESGKIAFLSPGSGESLETALEVIDFKEEDLDEDEDAIVVGHGLVIAYGTEVDDSNPDDKSMLVITRGGSLHWVVDTGHPQSDLGDALLVNSSVDAFIRCLNAHNAMTKETAHRKPLPAELDSWRAALTTVSQAIVTADRQAASRRDYWLPRVTKVLGDFRYNNEHLELASELINLVLDAGMKNRPEFF